MLTLAVLAPLTARGEPACPSPCDLRALIALAEQQGPGIEEAEAEVELAEARRSEAYLAPANIGSARLSAAPTAARRGDVGHTAQPDISFSDEMGLLVNIRIEAALALTPWWRIVSYWHAARAAVDMNEHRRDQVRAEVRLAVERAYRDAQIARETAELLRLAHRSLSRELAQVELLLDEDLPGAVEQDRLRLEVDLSALEARQIESQRDLRRAQSRLRRLAGLPARTRLVIEPLSPETPLLQPLDWYLEAARRNRPEVQLSLAAIRAAEAMVDVRRAELVPDLGIGGYYGYRSSPVVDDQRSQFARDLWNGVGLGYGLIYRWELGIGERVARLRAARADVEQAGALRRLALGGVAYQVEEAFAQALEETHTHEVRSRAREIARDWLAGVRERFARGDADGEELSDAFGMWLSQEQACLRALARLHQRHAELARASGLGA